MTGILVTFAVDSGGGTVLGDTVRTASDGIARTTEWQLGPLPGMNRLRATVTDLPPVVLTATARLGIATALVEGSVELPSGSTLDFRSLRVTSGITDVPVREFGALTTIVDTRGTQLAAVHAPNGNAVLLGWIGDKQAIFSAKTTAQAMAYFDVGAYLLPTGAQRQLVRDYLAKQADLSKVEAAIGDALRGSVETISLLVPRVIQARKDVVASLAGRVGKPTTAPLVRIDPSAIKSGIAVDQVGLNHLTITNNWRRRVVGFVDRVSWLPNGAKAALPVATAGDPIRLPAVTPVTSVVATAIDLLFGNYAGAPVVSPAQPVPPFVIDALNTKYRVTVVGPGFQRQKIELTPAQSGAQVRATIETLVIDVFVPLLDQALSFANLTRLPGEPEIAKLLAGVLDLNPTPVTEAILKGDLVGAMSELLKLLFDTSAGQNLLREVFLTPYAAEKGLASIKALDERFSRNQKALAIVEIIATTIAASSVFVDIGSARHAEQWDVDVSGAKIALDPDVANISSLDIETFTARVDGVEGIATPTFGYRWSTTGRFGQICAALTDHGANYCGPFFESSRETISYSPELLKEGSDEIRVEVFYLERGQRYFLGSSTAKVTTYRPKVSILPQSVSIQPNENASFTVMVDAPLLKGSGALSFRWSTPGRFGAFGSSGANFESGARSTTYVAGDAEGTENVTVDAFSTKNGVKTLLGSATAQVEVKRVKPTVVIGSWFVADPISVGGGRSCIFAYLKFPLVSGAKSYEVYAHGFNDPRLWGREIRVTLSPPFPSFSPCTPRSNPVNGQSGGEFLFMLSGGHGPDSGIPTSISQLTSRFAGMVVEATVRY